MSKVKEEGMRSVSLCWVERMDNESQYWSSSSYGFTMDKRLEIIPEWPTNRTNLPYFSCPCRGARRDIDHRPLNLSRTMRFLISYKNGSRACCFFRIFSRFCVFSRHVSRNLTQSLELLACLAQVFSSSRHYLSKNAKTNDNIWQILRLTSNGSLSHSSNSRSVED